MANENDKFSQSAAATKELAGLRALVAEEHPLSHYAKSLKDVYAMPVTDKRGDESGSNLGTRWSNLLKEVMGEDKFAGSNAAYTLDDDGSLKLTLRITKERAAMGKHMTDIHTLAEPLGDANIVYAPKVLTNVPKVLANGSNVIKTISVNPAQKGFIENLRAALIKKRDPSPGYEEGELSKSGTSELSPRAYALLKEQIIAEVEQDLWGDAGRDRSR